MKNSNIKDKSSGQIFLMSILVLAAVMTSALFLMSIFIKDFRQSIETSESVKAFYAADAAMEWEIYNSLNDPDIDKPEMENGTSYTSQNNFSESKNIKTVGISKKVNRGLEVNFSTE